MTVEATPPVLAIDRSRPPERIELGDGSSWVDLTRGFVLEPNALLAELVDTVSWMQAGTWRYDHYVDERRLGAGIRHDQAPPALRQSRLHLDAAYRVRFGDAVAIRYRDGSDFQGRHSDRQMKWLDDTLVAIVVIGTPRPFELRPRGDWRDPEARADTTGEVRLQLGDGDLMVMGGRCQQDWLHGVPEAPGHTEPRISITWRWTRRSGRPDTNPGYLDGRSFSDRPNMAGYRMRPPSPG